MSMHIIGKILGVNLKLTCIQLKSASSGTLQNPSVCIRTHAVRVFSVNSVMDGMKVTTILIVLKPLSARKKEKNVVSNTAPRSTLASLDQKI